MKKSNEKRRAAMIFLDRDGVLCQNNGPNGTGIYSYEEFRLVPNLRSCLQKLGRKDFWIGVITNQPDIARKKLLKSELIKMNTKLTETARKAKIMQSHFTIKFCPHDNEDMCRCRKPKTGMILQVMRQFKIKPETARFYMVGDKLTDLQVLKNYYEENLEPMGIGKGNIVTILLTWKYGDKNISRRMFTVGNARIVPSYEVHTLKSAIGIITRLERRRYPWL